MIELALNNPTMNVGYMEYNIMRELNVSEIEQVNGGHPLLLAGLYYGGMAVARWGAGRVGAWGAGAALAWFAE